MVDTYGKFMERLISTRRTSLLPIALVGLAVAMPLGVNCGVAYALGATESVRIHDSSRQTLTRHLTQAAQQFYGQQQVTAADVSRPVNLPTLSCVCLIEPLALVSEPISFQCLPEMIDLPPPSNF